MFDVYLLPEEHVAIREAVRAVCDGKVAPNAAAADESGEFPQASYDALRAADFHAPHVPEEFGGAGADERESGPGGAGRRSHGCGRGVRVRNGHARYLRSIDRQRLGRPRWFARAPRG